ncbi:hypothetical protein M4D51_04930 [Microbacterium sp. p3-SID338]|uniref:hypothetical protein n=1 Tax=unclassified Microbacterium TaxID=2609290 RepID=UPI000C7F9678|nr:MULTISPECIES: hypothetical protein [unclassified Microbacterium]MCT1395065.1 hypothetical protein [Microbacterium sp. p3-SID338]PMC02578.1 hypothetical protein CJ226_14380 [Microbacterium sp. UMB0228]
MSTDLPEPDAEAVFSDEDGVLYDDEVTPEYGILGFTLRELLIVGVWLVSFLVSFFPLSGGISLWGIGIQWILPIGVPTVAVFLLVLRRFSPDGIRRVGSLGIDQFASVAFSVSACVWAGNLWLALSAVISTGNWGLPWNAVVQVIASTALVVLTVFAPLIPGLKEDFQGRLVTLAHRNANPVRPVIPRPRPEASSNPSAAVTAPGEPYDVPPTRADGDTVVIANAEVEPSAAPTDDRADVPGAYTDTDTGDREAVANDADRVPLTAHASGGGTGTVPVAPEPEYTPSYSRRSRAEQPEIVSDTGSIESLLGAKALTEDELAAAQEPAPEAATAVQPVLSDHRDAEAPAPWDSAPVPQPFWILAPTERDVHDERGEPIFRIGPTAWALVIEDRGGAFVVRHDDGRIGYLHDIAGITKG